MIKEGREPPIHTGAEAKEIQRCTLAALLSAQENRDIYLEEITSEAEQAGGFPTEDQFLPGVSRAFSQGSDKE